MGYGKSLKEPVKSAFSEKPEIKLRQVPCDGMVCYATIPRKRRGNIHILMHNHVY
jgi:hypothetical protein